VVGADVDETVVGGNVIHAVGDRFADGIVGEVMNIDEFRLILRLPLSTMCALRGPLQAFPPPTPTSGASW